MRASFRARGRVQGVGFRAFVREEARRLGLAGWVRNEADGSVAGEAEGGDAAMAAFRASLERGPFPGTTRSLDWDLDSGMSDGGQSVSHPFDIRR